MTQKAAFVENYFAQIYLNIIALLQGIALFQLTPHLIEYWTSTPDKWTHIHTPVFLLTILIVFILWHHYVNGIVYLRWFPNILDAIIPFMIGITEFFMISFLEKNKTTGEINIQGWMNSFTCFLFFGAIAYYAAAVRHEADLFIHLMNKSSAAKHKKNLRRFYIQAGSSMLIQGLFAILIIAFHRQSYIWLSLLFFILHIGIAEHWHLTIIKPAFIQSISNVNKPEIHQREPVKMPVIRPGQRLSESS